MALMLAKTYAALKSAGASEEEAQAAAEELANYESRLGRIETGIELANQRIDALGRELNSRIDALGRELNVFRAEVGNRFTVLTWAVGINAAATLAILGVLLRH